MSHGSGPSIKAVAPRSNLYQGPFGRICPDLPPWKGNASEPAIDAELQDFAIDHMIEAPGKTPSEIANDETLRKQLDKKFNSKTPAGYTYFGQFIDHDITFDPASSLVRRNDPNGLLNFRTPRLDLDNIYGRGPADTPYLYDKDQPGKLLIGQVDGTTLFDLPRNHQGRALIGDMRNDENSMVSQLQLAFLLAHNTLVDRATAAGKDDPFEAARQTLRWLYQWIAWHDYLGHVTLKKVHDCALSLEKRCGGRMGWEMGLRDVYSWKHQPFMPVEFSVACYRFGHSMVRNSYQTNQHHRGNDEVVPIFDNVGAPSPDDLRGFRPMIKENVIQWNLFLRMKGSKPQKARKIDTKLSNALAHLHEGPAGSPMNVLAYRNLKRGWTFDLPSGSAVARKWCIEELDPPAKLDALFYYVLKEAEALPGSHAGQTLGGVGSTVLCAVFAGLLKGDPRCWMNVEPCWTPNDDPLLHPGDDNCDSKKNDEWELSSIIRLGGLPVTEQDVADQT